MTDDLIERAEEALVGVTDGHWFVDAIHANTILAPATSIRPKARP